MAEHHVSEPLSGLLGGELTGLTELWLEGDSPDGSVPLRLPQVARRCARDHGEGRNELCLRRAVRGELPGGAIGSRGGRARRGVPGPGIARGQHEREGW